MQIKLTPIIPRPINVTGIQHALIDGMRDMGQRIREEFEDTTKTWNHQPKWNPAFPIPRVAIDDITVETTTEDQRYKWINDGTRVGMPKYPIVPHNPPKALAFPSQFIPKTFPGIIGSGAGFSGGDTQLRKGVMHPGVEPRKFAETIAKNNKPNFKTTMERAMNVAAKASGHKL
jgi:hypothetical protein